MQGSRVIPLPKWVSIIRGFQLLFAIIVLGLSADGIYWIAFNSWGFALFTSLATMIIAIYALLTSNVASCAAAYNYWAVLALDIFGVILWLSAMAALAATRATFVVPTTIDGCVNDGDGGVCYRARDILDKRVYVASDGYLNMMSGAAGLSAIEMLLFIASLVIFCINLRRYRNSNTVPSNGKIEAHAMNPIETHQPYQPHYPQQAYPPQQPYQQPYQQAQYPELPVQNQRYAPVPSGDQW